MTHLTQEQLAAEVARVLEFESIRTRSKPGYLIGRSGLKYWLTDADPLPIIRQLWERANQWQPIQTAPRDGEPFICSDGEGVWLAKYSTSSNETHRGKLKLWATQYSKPSDHNFNITHWMPFPKPPIKTATGGE